MNFLKKSTLPFVVFLTGAAVLVIEIVATRILSPYFGNTIFTVSSVISVVLAALSVGYYIGGKIADRYPAEKVFYTIILLSGVSVLVLELLVLCVLPLLGYSLSVIIGPIVSSVLLFLIPNILLGTLSPFAIKLYGLREHTKGSGSVAGDIFFWSTLGSIFGSLSSGFILIPHLGVNHIIVGVGLLLCLLGLIPLASYGFKRSHILKILAALGIVSFVLYSAASANPQKVVLSTDGIYEKITVYDGTYNNHPTRFLAQDRSTSAAMYLDSPELVYDYSQYYNLYKIFQPQMRTALVIGGGAYSIPKALLTQTSTEQVDVSEIEPSLFAIGQKYFAVPDDQRLHNFTTDGRRLLHDTHTNYDLIFSDVYYSLYSIPAHFTTKEFFQIAQNKLAPNGVFMANLIGNLSRQEPSLILSEMKTFQTVFPNSYFFAVNSPTSTESQNIIFVGYNSTTTIDFTAPKVRLNSNSTIRTSAAHRINPDRFALSLYPTLTDDYAPIEYLTSAVLTKGAAHQNSGPDGGEIQALIEQQLSFGPRYMTAPGHTTEQSFITNELTALGMSVTAQHFDYTDTAGKIHHLTNIIGSTHPSSTNRFVLGTHYDSMRYAKYDPQNWTTPPPGANNSASGVAVLLETARWLSAHPTDLNNGIDFIFFDGEEGDEILSKPKTPWSQWHPLGSEYFAQHLTDIYPTNKPSQGIFVDVVCSEKEKVAIEAPPTSEATALAKDFKKNTDSWYPAVFIETRTDEVKDDHTALAAAGIPSILLINDHYRYLDPTADTLDKCSAKNTETVSNALLHYLTKKITS